MKQFPLFQFIKKMKLFHQFHWTIFKTVSISLPLYRPYRVSTSNLCINSLWYFSYDLVTPNSWMLIGVIEGQKEVEVGDHVVMGVVVGWNPLVVSQFAVKLFVAALAALGRLVAAKWGVPVDTSSAGSWCFLIGEMIFELKFKFWNCIWGFKSDMHITWFSNFCVLGFHLH